METIVKYNYIDLIGFIFSFLDWFHVETGPVIWRAPVHCGFQVQDKFCWAGEKGLTRRILTGS